MIQVVYIRSHTVKEGQRAWGGGTKKNLSNIELLLAHVTECIACVNITHSLTTRFYLEKVVRIITGRIAQACGWSLINSCNSWVKGRSLKNVEEVGGGVHHPACCKRWQKQNTGDPLILRAWNQKQLQTGYMHSYMDTESDTHLCASLSHHLSPTCQTHYH